MFKSQRGFTLIDLIVVMAVFVVIIMITADSFKTILTQMTKITKSEESNIEGVVGLEMFRHDIQQAGYGLPFSYLSGITYVEAGFTPASNYNDAPSGVPRAVVAGDNLGAVAGATGDEATNILAGTDYLTLKGSTLGMSDTAKKWTYMPYSSATTGKLVEGTSSVADRVIVLKKTYTTTSYTNQMITSANPAIYWARYYSSGFADTTFNPTLKEETYYLYGIKAGDPLGMPFNRVDYFVARPTTTGKIPSFCANNTGILYKGAVIHANAAADAKLTYIPLLDCVADMQVIFGWDVDDGQGNEGQDGVIDTYSTPLGSGGAITVTPSANQSRVTSALADPEKLRNSLKIIKVYLLGQVGRRDPNYQSPSASIVLGDASVDGITKTYTLTSDMLNYHWKTYRLVVRPKNLVANQ
jgi:prepilin-type N-terminal cleavage/methylation domain-containing protein